MTIINADRNSPSFLLKEMQNGIFTLKDNLVVSYKVKCSFTVWFSNCAPRYLLNWSKKSCSGNSLAAQWLGLCIFTAEGTGSTPTQGTKILQTVRRQNKNLNKKIKTLSTQKPAHESV